ncbi:response regulator [Mariprofundus erugo]|uniref:Response regulator n=1 Tax=Mariprofundus erugo TaxID=2528639 RepID=A0A5R9GRG7_9PROT|nr:response regulator [Mariprofundus erugo]TLS68178.1 response regulator [Mariprofundus erugo]TLS73707.1 response regulator [Mariprofundus erugo]
MKKTPQVLVVDDDMMIQIILGQLIRGFGMEALEAKSAEDVESLLSLHSPELILLDINIPGSDTRELLRSFRADPKLENTKIIMISGSDNLAEIAAYVNAGADDYILKPFHATLLKTRIIHALDGLERDQRQKGSYVHVKEAKQLLQKVIEDHAGMDAPLADGLNAVLDEMKESCRLLKKAGKSNVRLG